MVLDYWCWIQHLVTILQDWAGCQNEKGTNQAASSASPIIKGTFLPHLSDYIKWFVALMEQADDFWSSMKTHVVQNSSNSRILDWNENKSSLFTVCRSLKGYTNQLTFTWEGNQFYKEGEHFSSDVLICSTYIDILLPCKTFPRKSEHPLDLSISRDWIL